MVPSTLLPFCSALSTLLPPPSLPAICLEEEEEEKEEKTRWRKCDGGGGGGGEGEEEKRSKYGAGEEPGRRKGEAKEEERSSTALVARFTAHPPWLQRHSYDLLRRMLPHSTDHCSNLCLLITLQSAHTRFKGVEQERQTRVRYSKRARRHLCLSLTRFLQA